jgi:aldehyde:ferredoxin oxidoreductase
MDKIYIVDLTEEKIEIENYTVSSGVYGRGLAIELVEKYGNFECERYAAENVMVLAPGILTGTLTPSTGRMVLATKEGKGLGLQISNITGELPQKLASMDIAAIVIRGKARTKGTYLYIDKETIELRNEPFFMKKKVSEIITAVRNKYGRDAGMIGIGIAGDMMLPLSTLFSTYKDGTPEFYCLRGNLGDIFGSKNFKGIVVNSKNFFNASCANPVALSAEAKKITKIITENPICGFALPGYGSITLMKILKREGYFTLQEKNQNKNVSNGEKINKTCSPLCVIGCLNRHSNSDNEFFTSPAESEVNAALEEKCKINDWNFSKLVNERAFQLGLDSTEFIFSCSLFAKTQEIVPSEELILELLDEIEKGSLVGRVIGGRTTGIHKIYTDKSELINEITRPTIKEENNFKVNLSKKYEEFSDLEDIELLYSQIYILENLGFCIFSSFALIDNEEALQVMARLLSYKMGIDIEIRDLIAYGRNSLKKELDFFRKSAFHNIETNIPEFTKVLYRYFNKKEAPTN